MPSEQSAVDIKYAGKPLESRQRCEWKVRVWDKDGQVSPWSAPTRWTMGLLKPQDWKGKWIISGSFSGKTMIHPWLRQTFELKSDVKSAKVS